MSRPGDSFLPKLGKSNAPPFRPSATSAVWFNGTLLSFGGFVDGTPTSSVHYLPILGAESGWTEVICKGRPPCPRLHPVLSIHCGNLFVFGGVSGAGEPLKDCWSLSLDAKVRQWTDLSKEYKGPHISAKFAVCSANPGNPNDTSKLYLHDGSTQLLELDVAGTKCRKIADAAVPNALQDSQLVSLPSGNLLVFGGSEASTKGINESAYMILMGGEAVPEGASAGTKKQEQQAASDDDAAAKSNGSSRPSSGMHSDHDSRASSAHSRRSATEDEAAPPENEDSYVSRSNSAGSQKSNVSKKSNVSNSSKKSDGAEPEEEAKKSTQDDEPTLKTEEEQQEEQEEEKKQEDGENDDDVEVKQLSVMCIVDRGPEDLCAGFTFAVNPKEGRLYWYGPTPYYTILPLDPTQVPEAETQWKPLTKNRKKLKDFSSSPLQHPVLVHRADGSVLVTGGVGHGADSIRVLSSAGVRVILMSATQHVLRDDSAKPKAPRPPAVARASEQKAASARAHSRSRASTRQSPNRSRTPQDGTGQSKRTPRDTPADADFWSRGGVGPQPAKQPRKPSKRRAELSTRVMTSLARQADARGEQTIFSELKKTTSDTKHTAVDLSTTMGAEMQCDDLFLLRETLRSAAHVNTLNISTKIFGEFETKMFLSLVEGCPTLTEVIAVDTVFEPEAASEELQERVARNREYQEALKEHKHKQKEERRIKKERRKERQQRIRYRQEAKERQQVEFEAEHVNLTKFQQQEAREFGSLAQLFEMGTIQLECVENVNRIEQEEELRKQFAEKFESLIVEETEQREAEVKKAEGKARTELIRTERADMRIVSEKRRERKRMHKQQREELEKVERAERQEERAVEDEERSPIWSDWIEGKIKIKAVDDERAAAARAERLRIQAEEDRLREEEERQERLRQEQQRKFRAEREDMQKEETAIRQPMLLEGYDGLKQIHELRKDDFEEIKRQEAYEDRQAQREECNKIPPSVVIKGARNEVLLVQNTTEPVQVVLQDSSTEPITIAYNPTTPKYMRPSKNSADVVVLLSHEIGNEEWECQKKTLVSGSVTARVKSTESQPIQLMMIPDPAVLRCEGAPSGAGAEFFLPDAEDSFAKYVVTDDAVHLIDFDDKTSGAMFLALLNRFFVVPLGALNANDTISVVFDATFQFLDPGTPELTVESVWERSFLLRVHPPLLSFPPNFSTQVSYTEGDGDQSYFRNVTLENPLRLPSFFNAVLTVRLTPYCDTSDFLLIYTKSTIGFNDGRNKITHNGTDIGEIVTKGALQLPPSGGSMMKRSASQIPRKSDMEETQIRLNTNASVDAVKSLIRCIVFRNDSDDPVEGLRQLSVGLTFSTGLSTFICVDLEMIGQDDPTVIDFGMESVPFRLPSLVPQQHEQFTAENKFYFGSTCNVFDVDTTKFTGGRLTIGLASTSRSKDVLNVEPLPDSLIELGPDNKLQFKNVVIGTFEILPSMIKFEFGEASIEAVQAIFKTITFDTELNSIPKIPQPRTVDISFYCGSANPVHVSCGIKITEPLLSIPTSGAFWTFKEDAPLQPIADFKLCMEDDGWDGGFILVEYMHGRCDDDLLTMKESNMLKLVDESPPTPEATSAKKTGKGAKSSNDLKSEKSLVTAKSAVLEDPMSPHAEDSGVVSPPARKEMRGFGELKGVMRKRVTEQVRQLAAARAKAHDEMRLRIFEEVRARRHETVTETTTKAIILEGTKVGTVTISPESVMVHFIVSEKSRTVDPSKARVNFCTVKKNHVATVLRHICYRNVSDNPKELQKILRISASDGTPHSSLCTVEIEIQPSDDATELRRLNALDPKPFRSLSHGDKKGALLFDDVTLHDPDTFAFNGGTLVVELIGGGDPRQDSVYFLSEAQQRSRIHRKSITKDDDYLDEIHGLISVGGDDNNVLKVGKKRVGTVTFDTKGHSNVNVTFDPLPEGIEEPKEEEDVEKHPDVYLSILTVEKILQSLAYTNTSSKTKSGVRIFQARVGMKGVDGKLKMNLDVEGPLLANPEYGAGLRYKENAPEMAVFPKLSVNYSDKATLKKGIAKVEITTTEDENDKLGLGNLSKEGREYSVQKNALYFNKDFIGNLTIAPTCVTLTMDWASKCQPKHIQAFFRAVSYCNTSDDPKTIPRVLEAYISLNPDADPGFAITAGLDVVAEDDPTEIHLQQTSIELVRDGPAKFLAADALVEDPDSELFTEGSFLEIELKNAQPTDDLNFSVFSGETMYREDDKEKGHVIATYQYKGKNHSSLYVNLVDCTLPELQTIVQRATLKIASNVRDKVNKKTVVFSVKTGSAPTYRTTLNVEILPTLFEPTEATLADGREYKNAPLIIFPSVIVSQGNFTEGAEVDVKFDGDAPPPHLLNLVSQHNVSIKEARELPRDLLSIDGKNVGEATVHSKCHFSLTLPHSGPIHARLQKVLRSIQFDSTHGPPQEGVSVVVAVRDIAKQMSKTVKVKITHRAVTQSATF